MQKKPFELIMEQLVETGRLSTADLKLLPDKWELLGKVLVIKLNKRSKKHWPLIAEAYANVLKAKSVLRRTDKIRGVYRTPGVQLVWGESTDTVHTENGVKFKFNPKDVMFSSGNIDERIRISTLAGSKETIVDMFSGIGYFSLPIAVHSKPKLVISCELNPVAYDYLCQNILLNKVEDIVKPIMGDCRNEIQDQIADRIILGYIKSEDSHRAAALKILKPSGGIIHFHDVGFSDKAVGNAFDKILDSLSKLGYHKKFQPELFNHYKIKSYGPKLLHVVLDIKFEPI